MKQLWTVVLGPPAFHLPAASGPRYLTGAAADFESVDWHALGVDRGSALVVFADDGEAGFRRMLEAAALGFRHLFFDRNWPVGDGDSLSLKQVRCTGVQSVADTF